MKKFLLATSLILTLAPGVWAGPDETTNNLMKDSASMLDFGMLRLETAVERDLAESDWIGYVRVFYRWDNDEIIIEKFVYNYGLTKTDAEALCSEWIEKAKSHGGVFEGQLLGSISNSYFADYFEHFGFVRSNKTDNLLSEIDKKFRIECRVQFIADHKSGLNNITATSPLISKGYSVKESP